MSAAYLCYVRLIRRMGMLKINNWLHSALLKFFILFCGVSLCGTYSLGLDSESKSGLEEDLKKANILNLSGDYSATIELLTPYENSQLQNVDSVKRSEIYYLLGTSYFSLQKLEKSKLILNKIENLKFKNPKDKYLHFGRAYGMKAEIYRIQKKAEESEKFYEKAIADLEKAGQPAQFYYWVARTGYSALLIAKNRYSDAKEILYDLTKKIDDKKRLNLATLAKVYGNLGLVYKVEKEYSKATHWNLKSIEIRSKISGPDHPNLIIPYYNLGMLYVAQKKYREGYDEVSKAVSLARKIWPSDFHQLILMEKNLANIKKYLP